MKKNIEFNIFSFAFVDLTNDKKNRYSNIDIKKSFWNNDQNNLYHFLLQNCCHTKICGAS